MRCSIPAIAVLAFALALAGERPVAGRDPDPFEAFAGGSVWPSTSLARAGLGDLQARWRVAVGGGEAVEVRRDGTFAVAGAPAAVPRRGELHSASGGAVSEEMNELYNSLFDGSEALTIDGNASEPAFALSLTDSEGKRKLSFSSAGEAQRVFVSGLTPRGSSYGGNAGALEDPAVRIETSDPSVVTVEPDGLAIAAGSGLAWIRASGDGEWTQVLVEVDTRLDTDRDGMPDVWERAHGLAPEIDDAGGDLDGDGLSNLEEYELGTRPDSQDSDDDHLTDREEVLVHGTDPLNGDTDSDTSPDDIEVLSDTDPLNPNERSGTAFAPQHLGLRDLNFWSGKGLAVTPDDRVYVFTEEGVVVLYRISRSPFVLLRLDQQNVAADLRDIAVDGSLAFVAGGDAGLHVLDTQNGASLDFLTTVAVAGGVNAVAARDGIVYAVGGNGLRLLRRAVDGSFESLGELRLSTVLRVAVHADIAYLALALTREVLAVDISNPAAPRALGRVVLPASSGPFSALAAVHGAVYIAHGSAGLFAVSALDPNVLSLAGDSQAEFPGASFQHVSVLGNRLVTFAPSRPGEAQLFRILESGGFEWQSAVPLGTADPLLDVALSQEFFVGLTAPRITVARVLRSGDLAGLPPFGRLVVEGGRAVFSPGDTATVTAYARDDVYIERVKLFVDGVLRRDDQVPPFRMSLRLDPSRPLPYEVRVRAVGFDLRGNSGDIGVVTLRVDPDRDGDGLPDSIDPDRDGDGLSDVEERFLGEDGWISDPESTDSDGDGILDGEEAAAGADGWITDPSSPDTDGDGLSDPYEVAVLGTDPADSDSDGDGVLDGEEDSDGDELTNRDEAALGTDPRHPDTDRDQLADGLEHAIGLDPRRADTDGDGVRDGDEDTDGDGLQNRVEVTLGTHPGRADTDGDGLDDATEIDSKSDPTVPTDFSGLEITFRDRTVLLTNPLRVRRLVLVRSTLAVPAATRAGPTPLVLEVAEVLSVDGSSRIDARGRGYLGGRSGDNPGAAGLAPQGVALGGELAGGSHGGLGGRAGAGPVHEAQDAYGNLFAPSLAGGGGSAHASGGRGGDGGGVIRITAGEVVLAGAIDASGAGAPAVATGGGGAGGSVWLTCARLSGSGRVAADGGAAANASGAGGGGGGRVLVDCEDLAGFDRSRITARGGGLLPPPAQPIASGAAGTVVLRPGPDALGELVVENGGLEAGEPRTFVLGAGEGTIASIGDDFLVREGGAFRGDLVGLAVDPDARDDDFTSFRILAQAGDTIFTEPGLIDHAAVGDTFRGVVRLEALEVRDGGGLATDDRLALAADADEIVVGGGAIRAAELLLEQAPALRVEEGTLEVGLVRTAVPSALAVTVSDGGLRVEEGLDAGAVELARSVFVAGGRLRVASLRLTGSVLTVPEPVAGRAWPLELEASGTVDVDATSAIDLVGKGFVGAYGPGNASSRGETLAGAAAADGARGGSSAGIGGRGSAATGVAGSGYGAFDDPEAPGAGGGAEDVADPEALGVRGGNGGGLLRLEAAELVLAGAIDASGAGAARPDLFGSPRAGAGAGGGVVLDVGVLRGGGAIRAEGGAAQGDAARGHGGGGGGGRIALVYGDRSAFSGAFSVAGGEVLPGPAASVDAHGGAGTLFLRARAAATGELFVDGRGRVAREFLTYLGEHRAAMDGSGEGAVRLLRLVIRGGALVESLREVEVERPDDEGSPTQVTFLGGLRAPALRLPEVDVLNVRSGALDVATIAAGTTGVRRWEIRDSLWVVHGPVTGSTVNLRGATVLTVPEPSAGSVHGLDIAITGSLVLETASVVDLAGKGYVGGRRGGSENAQGETSDGEVFASGGRTGGSHGGLGGYQGEGLGLGTTVAPTYDDFQRPRRPGGGGSGRLDTVEPGYNGGGWVHIQASTVIINGLIDVQGDGVQRAAAPASAGGAGAGGGVWIQTGSLIGRGEINADGGDADGTSGSGAGGGGRVAIHYTSNIGFAASVHARGGRLSGGAVRPESTGGAGTVFFKAAAQPYGELFVDNGGRAQVFARTWLRPVGAGTVQAVTPTRLRGNIVFPVSDTKLEGQWVVVDGATAQPFRIVDNGFDELVTDPASGDLTAVAAPGTPFQGAIVLDRLVVTNAGAFDTRGDLVILTGPLEVSNGGVLVAPPVVEW